MKIIEREHEKVIEHLKNIKSSMDEMAEEGLGGEDFGTLYITTRLLPDARKIFTEAII